MYEENDVREVFGTSTGMMDCDQAEGDDMEDDDEGELKIAPASDFLYASRYCVMGAILSLLQVMFSSFTSDKISL